MKERFFSLLVATFCLLIKGVAIKATANTVEDDEITVTVEVAGSLSDVLAAQTEGNNVKNLVVKGQLNGTDIATLRSLKTLRKLDMKDVTLIASDAPYYVSSYHGDGVWYTNYTRYFLADERKHVKWQDGLSQASPQYDDYYDYNLAGAFQGLSLRSIVLPSSVHEIGRAEFAECTNLTSIEMSCGPTFVGEKACYSCTSLNRIPELGNLISMDEQAFMDCSALTPENLNKRLDLHQLDSIPAEAFRGCKNIEEVTFSSTVHFVDEMAFYNSGLKKLELPNAYTIYGNKAFASCSSLKDVDVHSSLYRIPYDLLLDCPWYNEPQREYGGLRFVGNVATEIVDGALYLHFKDTATGVADNFNGNTKDGTVKDRPLRAYMPNSVRYIGVYAFKDATMEKINLMSVEEIGEGAFYGSGIEDIFFTSPVKTIGKWAFKNTPLEYVTIPETVVSVGEEAFADCTSLKNVTYLSASTEGTSLFARCTSLKAVIFNDKIIHLPVGCCTGCTALETVSLPANLEIVSKDAFRGCAQLKDVVIPNTTTTIESYAFYGCSGIKKLTLGKHVNMIYNCAFNGLSGLEELNYQATHTGYYYLGGLQHGYAFTDLNSLKRLTIGEETEILKDNILENGFPKLKVLDYQAANMSTFSMITQSSIKLDTLILGTKVQTIPNVNAPYLFYGAKNIDLRAECMLTECQLARDAENLVIREGVKKIPTKGFMNCYYLNEAKFPSTVTDVGNMAFANCFGIGILKLNDNLEVIGDDVFNNCSNIAIDEFKLPEHLKSIGNRAFSGCVGIKCLKTSQSLESIGESAFYKCTNLDAIIFSPGLKEIGMGAFAKCSNLLHFKPCEGLTTIGSSAFDSCTSLTDIILPNSLINIGNYAFYNCDNLKEVYALYDESLPTIYYAFNSNTNTEGTLFVKTGTKAMYENATQWKWFKNIVEDEKLSSITIVKRETVDQSAIYNVDGRCTTNSHYGLNIVRYSDGSVKKVIIK